MRWRQVRVAAAVWPSRCFRTSDTRRQPLAAYSCGGSPGFCRFRGTPGSLLAADRLGPAEPRQPHLIRRRCLLSIGRSGFGGSVDGRPERQQATPTAYSGRRVRLVCDDQKTPGGPAAVERRVAALEQAFEERNLIPGGFIEEFS